MPKLSYKEMMSKVAQWCIDIPAIQQWIADFTPAALQVTKCIGPFVRSGNRTSWWEGWSPVFTTAQGTTVGDWVQVGNAIQSPDCITDMNVSLDMGNLYFRVRRARLYHWTDWRILVNGAPVITETYDQYMYEDGRTGGDIPSVPVDIEPNKTSNATRNAVAAGATVTVEIRQRWNVNGIQTSAYARFINGLRSQVTATFIPRELVTEVTQ